MQTQNHLIATHIVKRYLESIWGLDMPLKNNSDIKPFPTKKQGLNRLEMLVIGLIIGLGSMWGIQTALNAKSPNNQLYEQTERKIKAMERVAKVDYEANTISIIKFKDNCFQLKSLKMPLSPECKKVLK